MAVSLKDVAHHVGLSIPTVSLILNGRGGSYRAETRRRVLQAAETLNYRPDSAARRTRRLSRAHDAIGLLVRTESATNLENAPVHEFICGVNDVLLEQQQFLVLVKINHLQEAAGGSPPRLIAEHFIDGLIVESGLPEMLETAVNRYAIPTVWLNCGHHDLTDCVYPDEVHASRLATEHLIQLGHRRILYVPARVVGYDPRVISINHFSVVERQQGYQQAMLAAGLTPQTADASCGPENIAKAGIQAVIDSRRSTQPITGVVTYAFNTAVRGLAALAQAGVRCPADVSIISSEELYSQRRDWPEITGVSCNRYEMGKAAARMILEKVRQAGLAGASQVFRGKIVPGVTVGLVAGGESAGVPQAARLEKTLHFRGEKPRASGSASHR